MEANALPAAGNIPLGAPRVGSTVPVAQAANDAAPAPVDYRTDPSRYRHWSLAFDGTVATLSLGIDEDGGIRPGYKLKLNSYDLGVDIELNDAVNRIRFEHPEVRTVVLSRRRKRPCVLRRRQHPHARQVSTHAHKVNFCKFTNETRNAFEAAGAVSPGSILHLRPSRARARAGATSLRSPATTSCWTDDRLLEPSALPEVPLLARAAGHRRPDARHRQAQGAARPWPTCSVRSTEGLQAASGRRTGTSRRRGRAQARPCSPQTVAARAHEFAGARRATGPPTAKGVRLTPLERTFRGGRRLSPIPSCRGRRSTARQAPRQR